MDRPETYMINGTNFASFPRRFTAGAIDVMLFVCLHVAMQAHAYSSLTAHLFFVFVVYLYYATLFSSHYQATLGGICVSIKATNLHGSRLSVWHSAWRFVIIGSILFQMVWGASFALVVSLFKPEALQEAVLSIKVMVGLVPNSSHQEGLFWQLSYMSYMVFFFLLCLPILFTKEKTSVFDVLGKTRFVQDMHADLLPGIIIPNLSRRFLAFCIDLVLLVLIWVFVTLVIWKLTAIFDIGIVARLLLDGMIGFYLLVVWVAIQLGIPGIGLNKTLGMKLLRMKWVQSRTGEKPTFAQYFIRFGYYCLVHLPLIVALINQQIALFKAPEMLNSEANLYALSLEAGTAIFIVVTLRGINCVPLFFNKSSATLTDKISGISVVRK
jgi:uncharacterized RDD family membrane protein YckC